MKVLGIIPARGGSKGVLRKNIREVDGKPLIHYTIDTALKSSKISKLLVTTDDLEIKEVSEKAGCEVQLRTKENATDTAKIEGVIDEVLSKLDENYDIIILLQPTAPIRETEDIDNVIKVFSENQTIESVVSVIELDDIHPARMYRLGEKAEMISLNPELEKKRRQELPKVYLRNGSIYAVRTDIFKKEGKVITANKKAYIMPESKWANVDTERDLIITEALIKLWKKGEL
ncbi:cytidylyltransferase domain-containing protein [Aureivirga sp. CE67]|uniref:acylneuraminate cytidylyltransferase family protein n=1 Tax=Aureivirga sp. CE67 TaxID=1788983 RepID=UPI0018CAEF7B|nr:acylneuraminate cytidylyltransferase family protein [Aureivirga sp. CE67]